MLFGSIYRSDLVQWLLTTGRADLAYAKLPEVLGVDPLLLALVFSEAILLFLYVVARTKARRKDELEKTVEQERVAAGFEDAASQPAGD